MRTDITLCLNSKVDGKQPYIEDRIYYGGESIRVLRPPLKVTEIGYYTLKKISTYILTRERSEEEKLRRHLYGDKGAKFSGGKVPKVTPPAVIGTITTMITKDILLIEADED